MDALPLGVARASRVARWSVSGVFFLTGFGTANWAVRIPAVQSALALNEARLGIALLGVSAGAMVAMPLSGRLVARFGSRPVTLAGAIAFAGALTLPALAPSLPWLLVALFALGSTNGVLDVAMNAQAAAVQRGYSKPIMGGVHAFYSFGGLIGAVIGGRLASHGTSVATHLAIVGASIFAGGVGAAVGLLPARTDAAPNRPRRPGQLRALALLGILAFLVLFGEGAMTNWSAVYLRNVVGTGPGLAAAGFATFSLLMALGRTVGDSLTSRLGSERLTQIGGAIAASGMVAAMLVPNALVVVAGFGAVGAGLSIVFPIVLAASARTPGVVPGSAIAMVATCGYAGLLAGPPLIGAVANVLTLRGGLALVAVTSVGVVLLARAVRESGARARSGGSYQASVTDSLPMHS